MSLQVGVLGAVAVRLFHDGAPQVDLADDEPARQHAQPVLAQGVEVTRRGQFKNMTLCFGSGAGGHAPSESRDFRILQKLDIGAFTVGCLKRV